MPLSENRKAELLAAEMIRKTINEIDTTDDVPTLIVLLGELHFAAIALRSRLEDRKFERPASS